MEEYKIKPVAHMKSDFPTKFGIPRQAGIVPALESRIVFEPEYGDREALRGIEGFSHLWLIWGFSEVRREGWSPTVRPPRLGGNVRMGVFATRSPFRPNSLGLSCVRLVSVEKDGSLRVSGADLMDGTPIFDIKPYVPYADSHPDAASASRQTRGGSSAWNSRPAAPPGYRRKSWKPCGASWPGTPAPDTRASRGVYTPWNLPPWR